MTVTDALNKISRANLNAYMRDCWGEDGAEWDSKADLISDIIRFGKASDCLAYCQN